MSVEKTAAVLFSVEGEGHTWPGAVALARLGATTEEIDATDEIWEFFVAQGGARPYGSAGGLQRA